MTAQIENKLLKRNKEDKTGRNKKKMIKSKPKLTRDKRKWMLKNNEINLRQ